MPDLKLGRLPDRTPVKITISVKPDLHAALQSYAAFYRKSYGQDEPVAELIPYMLESFLESDRGFAKARKDTPPPSGGEARSRRGASGQSQAKED